MSDSPDKTLAAEMLDQVEQSTKENPAKGKKKDKKKSKRKKAETGIGSLRGVETLFRNVMRIGPTLT